MCTLEFIHVYIFYTSVSFPKWFVLHIVRVMRACVCVCARARARVYKYINIWFAPPRPRALIYGDPPVSLICGRFRNCMCHDPFYSTLGSNPLLLYLENGTLSSSSGRRSEGGCTDFFFFLFFSPIESYGVFFVCVFIPVELTCLWPYDKTIIDCTLCDILKRKKIIIDVYII